MAILAQQPSAEAGRVFIVGAVLDDAWRDLSGTWTPDGIEWDTLPPRSWPGQRHPDLVVTSEGLVAWAPGDEHGWLLDEAEGSWRSLPPPPVTARREAALAWTGEELLIWGGTSGQRVFADGAAWHPD